MLYTIGIDEVGRGALAGPVVVAALALPKNWKPSRKIMDSKSLTPLAREKLAKWVKSKGLVYVIARVYPKVIDKVNITRAANIAAERALHKLFTKSRFVRLGKRRSGVSIYLDGGLYLRDRSYQESLEFKVKTVIRGDKKFNAVKLASVIAKVTRDRYMVKLHEFYPNYGFNIHKGYGTKSHRRAIRKYGFSDAHRKSFKVKW